MNELKYASIRMLISSMFEIPANGNRMTDICFDRKTIRYREESEIQAMRGGVILIKEPLVELITDEDLADMGFGC
ncbi:MAG: hypothetical protein ABOK23_00335 [Candidatus Methanoperedens sp.]|nr:hypothetical protein [Candidatus Methanoperedens sp.]